MERGARVVAAIVGVGYAVFALGCFHLAVAHPWERGVSLGEGAFTLLGAAGLLVVSARRPHAALIALACTAPLIGWFAATPWNSGTPFLVASTFAPAVAALALVRARRRRHRVA